MEKPILDPEEWIISLSDVKRLYMATWRRLLKWAVIGACFAFLYFASSTPKYQIEASFKEGVERSNHSENVLLQMIGSASMTPQQPWASTLMKSYQVLRPVVEKMGLQITEQRSDWLGKKVIRRFKEAFAAEKGRTLTDLDPFVFQNVVYEEEKPAFFNLTFTDPNHFIVSNKRKNEIGKGTVGEAVRLEAPSIQFTLAQCPQKMKVGTSYRFGAGHWIGACGGVRKEIKITTDKLNKSILNICLSHRDRHLGVRLVNQVMHEYQNYLKREYDLTAKEQLAYLENKQEQIFERMEDLFAEHVDYLSQNLKKKGVIGLEQETQSLLIPHQEMHKKVLAIDVELSRLDELEGKSVAIAEEGPFSSGLNQIAHKIQDLKQQRDLLELSLCQISSLSLETRREELKEIRNQRFEVEKMIQEVDLGEEISSFDIDQGIATWARALRDPEEREDLAEYLENYSRLLSMREKMLQERVFYGNNTPIELEGMDLASARGLFLEYNGRLDAAEASMRHYDQFKKEISNADFELASLSSVLRDPICQKLIAEGSSLELQLKDVKHHSQKEEERWQEEIALQKKILSAHLDQLYKVEEVNASLIRDKMVGLQKLSLDCINRQISVLHEQANDSVKARRKSLLAERRLLEGKMDEIRNNLATVLPEKWQFEKWLTIKTGMITKVMETVTEVVESKTISNRLHQVESKPLDRANLPTAPKAPRLYTMTFLGGFAFSFFLFCLLFIQQIVKGFPASLEKLNALRLPVSGPISAFCDGPTVETPTGPDLELLRKLALFSEGGKVIGLIGGKGPDYSFALAENLSRMSAKSIVVRCDFLSKFRQEDCPGLLQVWKGEIGEMPIRKGKGFDFLTAGGYTPFGTEIIQSQSFTQLIEILKKNYTWVFLLFRTPLSSAESLAALRLCDKAVVTVSGEQTEELTPFVNWGYIGDNCRLTFITRA